VLDQIGKRQQQSDLQRPVCGTAYSYQTLDYMGRTNQVIPRNGGQGSGGGHLGQRNLAKLKERRAEKLGDRKAKERYAQESEAYSKKVEHHQKNLAEKNPNLRARSARSLYFNDAAGLVTLAAFAAWRQSVRNNAFTNGAGDATANDPINPKANSINSQSKSTDQDHILISEENNVKFVAKLSVTSAADPEKIPMRFEVDVTSQTSDLAQTNSNVAFNFRARKKNPLSLVGVDVVSPEAERRRRLLETKNAMQRARDDYFATRGRHSSSVLNVFMFSVHWAVHKENMLRELRVSEIKRIVEKIVQKVKLEKEQKEGKIQGLKNKLLALAKKHLEVLSLQLQQNPQKHAAFGVNKNSSSSVNNNSSEGVDQLVKAVQSEMRQQKLALAAVQAFEKQWAEEVAGARKNSRSLRTNSVHSTVHSTRKPNHNKDINGTGNESNENSGVVCARGASMAVGARAAAKRDQQATTGMGNGRDSQSTEYNDRRLNHDSEALQDVREVFSGDGRAEELEGWLENDTDSADSENNPTANAFSTTRKSIANELKKMLEQETAARERYLSTKFSHGSHDLQKWDTWLRSMMDHQGWVGRDIQKMKPGDERPVSQGLGEAVVGAVSEALFGETVEKTKSPKQLRTEGEQMRIWKMECYYCQTDCSVCRRLVQPLEKNALQNSRNRHTLEQGLMQSIEAETMAKMLWMKLQIEDRAEYSMKIKKLVQQLVDKTKKEELIEMMGFLSAGNDDSGDNLDADEDESEVINSINLDNVDEAQRSLFSRGSGPDSGYGWAAEVMAEMQGGNNMDSAYAAQKAWDNRDLLSSAQGRRMNIELNGRLGARGTSKKSSLRGPTSNSVRNSRGGFNGVFSQHRNARSDFLSVLLRTLSSTHTSTLLSATPETADQVAQRLKTNLGNNESATTQFLDQMFGDESQLTKTVAQAAKAKELITESQFQDKWKTEYLKVILEQFGSSSGMDLGFGNESGVSYSNGTHGTQKSAKSTHIPTHAKIHLLNLVRMNLQRKYIVSSDTEAVKESRIEMSKTFEQKERERKERERDAKKGKVAPDEIPEDEQDDFHAPGQSSWDKSENHLRLHLLVRLNILKREFVEYKNWEKLRELDK
jgi:hypothetical protein